jgi:two-component system, NtrC family, response regulator HydG
LQQLVVKVGTTRIADVERWLIQSTLDHFDGNKTAAARALGISLKTIYNKLDSYRRAA